MLLLVSLHGLPAPPCWLHHISSQRAQGSAITAQFPAAAPPLPAFAAALAAALAAAFSSFSLFFSARSCMQSSCVPDSGVGTFM